MKVEYVDHMGTDLMVANSARVSLDKHHEYFDATDERLLNYLASHNHWSPFAHPTICLRVTIPIFVARQLAKHQVGAVVNEISRRYVDSDPEFYITDKLGARAENIKQGAKEGEFVEGLSTYADGKKYYGCTVQEYLESKWEEDLDAYKWLLENGVAPEDARIVLPLSVYTSWYWTGSLYFFAHMYSLRSKPDAQRQTREVAEMIGNIIEPLFPFSWHALTKSTKSS
jgi:thymidylate synthase (FAD)